MEQYGYPKITKDLRAKVFGFNAMKPYKVKLADLPQRIANDAMAQERREYRAEADPHFLTYGPKSRRQFLNLLRASQGHIS